MKNILKQKNTWVGITLITTALGIHLDPDHLREFLEALMALIGSIAILTNTENKRS